MGEATEPERLAAKSQERVISVGDSEAPAEEQCNLVHEPALSSHLLGGEALPSASTSGGDGS